MENQLGFKCQDIKLKNQMNSETCAEEITLLQMEIFLSRAESRPLEMGLRLAWQHSQI